MKVIALPDVHFPFQDKRAFALALKIIDWVKPDLTVILGDWCDAYSISRYTKSPLRDNKLKHEVDAARAGIKALRAISPEIVFLQGNHELRLDKFIAERCPELFGLVSMRELLGIESKEWHEYQHVFRLGKMSYVHDLGYSGANALARTVAACGTNVTMGHLHSAGVHYAGTMDGERHVGVLSGWLGDRKFIDYASPATTQNWQLGLTLVQYDNRMNAHAQFIPFVGGKACVNGGIISL